MNYSDIVTISDTISRRQQVVPLLVKKKRMANCSSETASTERRTGNSEIFPGRSGDLLPSKFVEKLESLRSANDGLGSKVAQITDALPDLAGLALPPTFTGDVCTIMGDGSQRSSAGAAVGILIAPILAVSRLARILGIDLSPQSFGIDEPDFYASPTSVSARLDALEFRLIRRLGPPTNSLSPTQADQFAQEIKVMGECVSSESGAVDAVVHDCQLTNSKPQLCECVSEGVSFSGALEAEAGAIDAAVEDGPRSSDSTDSKDNQNNDDLTSSGKCSRLQSSQSPKDQMTCSVCQCDFEDGEYAIAIRKCQHSFHAQCLRPWLDRRHTCPMCREPIVEEAAARTKPR